MMESAISKIIGVLAGSFLALVLDPPRSRLGFIRRTGAAVVGGFIFGSLVLSFSGLTPTPENIMAAWCLASFGAWSGMGRLKKIIENYRKD